MDGIAWANKSILICVMTMASWISYLKLRWKHRTRDRTVAAATCKLICSRCVLSTLLFLINLNMRAHFVYARVWCVERGETETGRNYFEFCVTQIQKRKIKQETRGDNCRPDCHVELKKFLCYRIRFISSSSAICANAVVCIYHLFNVFKTRAKNPNVASDVFCLVASMCLSQ